MVTFDVFRVRQQRQRRQFVFDRVVIELQLRSGLFDRALGRLQRLAVQRLNHFFRLLNGGGAGFCCVGRDRCDVFFVIEFFKDIGVIFVIRHRGIVIDPRILRQLRRLMCDVLFDALLLRGQTVGRGLNGSGQGAHAAGRNRCCGLDGHVGNHRRFHLDRRMASGQGRFCAQRCTARRGVHDQRIRATSTAFGQGRFGFDPGLRCGAQAGFDGVRDFGADAVAGRCFDVVHHDLFNQFRFRQRFLTFDQGRHARQEALLFFDDRFGRVLLTNVIGVHIRFD